MSDDIDFHEVLNRCKRTAARNIRWITRSILLILFAVVVLHKVFPPAVERIGKSFGFEEPNIATMLGGVRDFV